VTEQYQQGSINLMPSAAIFQAAIGGVDVLIPGATVTPLPLQVVSDTASLIAHVPGSSEIEFLADGTFLAQWNISINVASGGRKNSQTALFIDSGAGFLPVVGTFGFGYHRNTASGRDTTSGEFRSQQVVSGTKIQIASQRISGLGNLEFIASSCSLLVGFVPFN
jgi:hypothetical protein